MDSGLVLPTSSHKKTIFLTLVGGGREKEGFGKNSPPSPSPLYPLFSPPSPVPFLLLFFFPSSSFRLVCHPFSRSARPPLPPPPPPPPPALSVKEEERPHHSWARTPRILRARGGGVYYIKFVSYYNEIRRQGVGWGGFITLTPCVPRYGPHSVPPSKSQSWSGANLFSSSSSSFLGEATKGQDSEGGGGGVRGRDKRKEKPERRG